MNKRIKLAISLILILSLGLTTIWSTAPKLFSTQFLLLLVGLAIMYFFYKLDLGLLFSLSPFLYCLSIFLLIITLIVGETTRGATRWLGPIQTSEMIKPFLAVFYAHFLSVWGVKKLKNFIIYTFLALLPAFLVKLEPDLGSALVLITLAGSMAIFSGLNLKLVSLSLAIIIAIIPLVPHLLKPYQLDRLQSFINPHEDPQGRGYNALQSIIAIGSGGLIGKGVRLGTQSHLNFLPERHTDFIFASFAEEFGFFGIIIILSAYFYLFFNLLKEITTLRESNHRLLQFGILSIFVFQVVVNIGMNLGLLPVTGITLPLFSYGGSSLISFMALLGISANLLELTPRFKI